MEKEKPPVFGMTELGVSVVIRTLENVKQKTIGLSIQTTLTAGTLVNTDENEIYAPLEQWGYRHQAVCHGRSEIARNDDGDSFHEVHINTMEGFWSLLRSWLRPHRGISQHKLPLYLGFFEFVHYVRKRGKALFSSLVFLLLEWDSDLHKEP
jgi:transposase-like protein